MIVYCTTNIINGKKYIGKSVSERPGYLGSGKAFLNAVKKYGKKNFKKQVLAQTEDKYFLNELEQYYINYYNAIASPLFYNITAGGEGGNTFQSYKTKKKVYQFDIYGNLIKEWDSATTASKQLNLNRSRIVTECKDGGSYNYSLWAHTSQYIQKNVKPRIRKKIIQKTLDNKIVKVWECLIDIQKQLNFNKANVLKVLQNKNKTMYGFKWEYLQWREN